MSLNIELLADLAHAEAERWPGRSPQRRAAAHAWVALTVPPAKSLDAARRAIASYGTAATQAAALALLDKIITERTTAP